MAGKKKTKSASQSIARKKKGLPIKLPDGDPDEEELDFAVHNFDCSLHPPGKKVFDDIPEPPQRKHVQKFELKIRLKGAPDRTLKYERQIDAIFLTSRTAKMWADAYPPTNGPNWMKAKPSSSKPT